MNTTYRGPWADTSDGAVVQALAAKGLNILDYLPLNYSDGSVNLVPVEGTMEISVEVKYSEARDQYQATLRRYPEIDRT